MRIFGGSGLVAVLGWCLGCAAGPSGPTAAQEQERARQEQVALARTKGRAMYAEVAKVAALRGRVAAAVEEASPAMATDPVKAAAVLSPLLDELIKAPDLGALFGWELASVEPEGIRGVFGLYAEVAALRIEVTMLAHFLQANVGALSGPGAPRLLGLRFDGHAVLVERGEMLCGEAPCAAGEEGRATGFTVRDHLAGEFVPAKIGTKRGQVMLLAAEGEVFATAIGLAPENHVRQVVAMQVARILARLEDTEKAEHRALKALGDYAEHPVVDASGPAP